MLSDETVKLGNFPSRLVDVGHKVGFIRNIGGRVSVDHGSQAVTVDPAALATDGLGREEYDVPIRTTYLLAASQLVRNGIARIPYPGGCAIGGGPAGGRGFDLHVMVWEKLGCDVVERFDHIEIVARDGLVGGEIDFPISTVGGTENALLCASVAKGITEIANAYITPEVEDLIELLRRMGAVITVYGTSRITVEGQNGTLSGAHMEVMPDRIEALTWIVYGVISGGAITIDNVPFAAMEVPLIHVEKAGIDLYRNSTSVHVSPTCLLSGSVQPFELACGTHPGVISDMQALFVLLGLMGDGTSRVYDYRYPERIAFVDELAKLVVGDRLRARPGAIEIQGPARFQAGIADSTDLRGSMAVVIAALCAQGRSEIHNVQMALRGYNDLANKLTRLGAGLQLQDEPRDEIFG